MAAFPQCVLYSQALAHFLTRYFMAIFYDLRCRTLQIFGDSVAGTKSDLPRHVGREQIFLSVHLFEDNNIGLAIVVHCAHRLIGSSSDPVKNTCVNFPVAVPAKCTGTP